jgi:hypothetical protein
MSETAPSTRQTERTLEDENAFGVLIAYFSIEDDEYAEEHTDRFVDRFTLFERLLMDYLTECPLGSGAVALSLGHALYVEVGDGDQTQSPLAWSRTLQARLREQAFQTTCAVTHGGSWRQSGGAVDVDSRLSTPAGELPLVRASLPSEPLRRALYAECASHGAPGEAQAWGPGMYVDTEVIEALGLSPKNNPTVLSVAGAEFYRLGR